MNHKQTEQDTKKSQKRRIPWWVSIISAIITYCTLKYVLPELEPANQKLQSLFALGPVAAPVVTIPFLLLAAKQLYDTDIPTGEQRDSDETISPD